MDNLATENFSIYISFNIQYKVDFGQAVYIVGNIPELGTWNLKNAVQLKWFEGNNWKFVVEVKKPQTSKFFEYKYCVASYDKQLIKDNIIWEEGQNRYLEIKQQCAQGLILNDVWGHKRVIIELEFSVNCHQAFIRFDKNSEFMKMESNQIRKCWEKEILIPLIQEQVKYEFGIKEKQSSAIIIDRSPRKIDMSGSYTPTKIKKTANAIISKDTLANNVFKCQKIDDNIFIGNYPRTVKDIIRLQQMGVKAVLNLQTQSDMKGKGISLKKLHAEYINQKIYLHNYQVIDMAPEDMGYKLNDISQIIAYLIKKYQTIYVHCTAGIFRSPIAVAGYYVFFKKMDINMAVQKIEERYPVSKMSRQYGQQVFSTYYKQNNHPKKEKWQAILSF